MEVSHEPEGADSRLTDLVTLVRDTIRRRWLTLLIVTAVIFAIGAAGVFLMTPKYTSIASIKIDPARNPLANNVAPNPADSQLSPEAIETEVSLLGSIDVARQVVQQLRLDTDPEFTSKVTQTADKPMTPAAFQTAIAREVLKHLDVDRDKLSYILTAKYTSPDAEKSAVIANAFAQVYIDTKVGNGANTATNQANWFQQRLDALGKDVSAADAKAAQYRAQAGIVQDAAGNNVGTIVDQQIAPLSTELATAQSDAAQAQSKYQTARVQLAQHNLDAVPEVLSSAVVTDLRRQRAQTQQEVNEVQLRYGDRHPESIRVHDQLDAIDAQINAEASRIVESLRANASAADARVGSLRASMGQLQERQSSNTRAAVLADSLQRDAVTKRANFDRMSQLSLNAIEGSKVVIAQAEIVSRAVPPSKPTSPNKPLLLALALIVGLAAGGATIAVQEMMVTGMRTIEDVQNRLGLPVLAALPRMPKSTSPADMLLDRPTSLYAESLRIARAAILGVRTSKPKRVIAITSALPSEGKTTTALAFARTLAINNAKTLLLECDVRRAQMRHLVREAPTGPGIVEVLHGEADYRQAIVPGDVPGLDHLLVKAPYFSSEDLFGGGTMERLLERLRQEYELIVLDLPPLIGLADGRFLAVLADATAMVIKWDDTPPAAAASAIEWLKSDGANPVGVLYNMVDTSAEVIGGLYYSKKYSAYYQAA